MANANRTQQFKYKVLQIPEHADYSDIDFTTALTALGDVLSTDDVDANTRCGLGSAVLIIAERLQHAIHDVPSNIERKVENALATPDTREEALSGAVETNGFKLFVDPVQLGHYAIANFNGGWELMASSLDEVESWIETHVEKPSNVKEIAS